jgi:hypothetical protein
VRPDVIVLAGTAPLRGAWASLSDPACANRGRRAVAVMLGAIVFYLLAAPSLGFLPVAAILVGGAGGVVRRARLANGRCRRRWWRAGRALVLRHADARAAAARLFMQLLFGG